MSLEQTNVIDFIGIDKQSGYITLTLTDAHDWSEELNHLYLLQEKINSYLAFIESGEINEKYPKATGKEIEISISFKHEVSNKAMDFLLYTSNIIKKAGFGFSCKVVNSDDGTWKSIL